MPRNRFDLLFSGQFVTTITDIPLNRIDPVYARVTHQKRLPAGALGVVVSATKPDSVRYVVVFFTRPSLKLRLRAWDIEPVSIDILIQRAGEVGFATWTKHHTPLLPAYMRSGQDVETQRNDG